MPSDGTTASSGDPAHAVGDAPASTTSTSTTGTNGASGVQTATEGDSYTNTSGDTTKAPAGVSEGSEGLDKAADATTDDAKDAEKGSEPTDGTVDDNADATENDSAANAGDENGGNSSKNSSADHENDGNPADDSTQNDNRRLPSTPDAWRAIPPSTSPVRTTNATPPFSGDDSSNASLVTPKDSNAPPGARVDSPPPPDDGTYFIRWETYPTYWMGQENEKLIVKINPESTYALDWVVAHIRGAAYDNVYSLRCGDFYLAMARRHRGRPLRSQRRPVRGPQRQFLLAHRRLLEHRGRDGLLPVRHERGSTRSPSPWITTGTSTASSATATART